MNPALTLARARGMGGIFDDPYGGDFFTGNPQSGGVFGGGVDSAGHSTRDFIGQLVGHGIQTVRDIWGRPVAQGSPQAVYSAASATTPYQDPNVYGSGAVTGQGIRIGSTVLSWPVLGLGVVGLMLLQSKGFSRR